MSIELRSSHIHVMLLLCHSPQFVVQVEGRWLLLHRGRVATNTTTGTSQVRGHELEEKRCSEKDL